MNVNTKILILTVSVVVLAVMQLLFSEARGTELYYLSFVADVIVYVLLLYYVIKLFKETKRKKSMEEKHE